MYICVYIYVSRMYSLAPGCLLSRLHCVHAAPVLPGLPTSVRRRVHRRHGRDARWPRPLSALRQLPRGRGTRPRTPERVGRAAAARVPSPRVQKHAASLHIQGHARVCKRVQQTPDPRSCTARRISVSSPSWRCTAARRGCWRQRIVKRITVTRTRTSTPLKPQRRRLDRGRPSNKSGDTLLYEQSTLRPYVPRVHGAQDRVCCGIRSRPQSK